MTIELLTCPFCGNAAQIYSAPHVVYGNRRPLWGVECSAHDCDGGLAGFVSKENAVTAWNRRHNNAILLAFYNEVCDQAERNMAATNTVSGAHWNAMRHVLKSKGVEVTR